MKITINGEPHALSKAVSVSDLVTELRLDTRKIAIERNREIVSHSQYDSTIIREGDEVEVVAFIGGG